jgi:hypothetical protein
MTEDRAAPRTEATTADERAAWSVEHREYDALGQDGTWTPVCAVDRRPWPCPTIRLLREREAALVAPLDVAAWVEQVRVKFRLDKATGSKDYWDGYRAAVDDVERLAPPPLAARQIDVDRLAEAMYADGCIQPPQTDHAAHVLADLGRLAPPPLAAGAKAEPCEDEACPVGFIHEAHEVAVDPLEADCRASR